MASVEKLSQFAAFEFVNFETFFFVVANFVTVANISHNFHSAFISGIPDYRSAVAFATVVATVSASNAPNAPNAIWQGVGG